jgi:hypothetical protein
VKSSGSSPEFEIGRPVGSAVAVLRAIFLSPRRFYLGFSTDGPLREPALFVLLIGTVSAVLRLGIEFVFSAGSLANIGVTALEAVLYAVLSPVLVAVFAGAYLLSARTFLGPEATFRGIYRMLAYAFGATILAPIPVVDAFAFTYATFVLMALAFRFVHGTSLTRSAVTTLVGYVPCAILYLLLVVQVAGFTATQG